MNLSDLKGKTVAGNILAWISMLVLFGVMDGNGIKKYVVAFGICGVFFLVGRKKKWAVEEMLCVIIPTIVYILLGILNNMFHATTQVSAIKTVIYCLTPLFLAFFLYVYYGKNIEYVVNVQFWCSLIIYLSSNLEIFFPIIKYYQNDISRLIQEFKWESSYAFAFGVFSLYYAYKKQWWKFGIALILAYIGNKRIVLAAIELSLAIMLVVWLFQMNKKLVYIIWGAITAGVYGYLIYIYSGAVNFWSEVFNLNSNGRLKIYARVINQYEFSPGYWGKGLGVIENLLECWNIETFANLHNDLLKFYIELGFWGLVVYLLSYYLMFILAERNAGKTVLCYLLGIMVYTVVLLATDNVSIYLIYLIPFYSTIFAALSFGKKKESHKEECTC